MLTYANEPQMRLARTMAWERGVRIDFSKIESAGGLSVVMDRLRKEHPALPATPEQIAEYQTLVGECVAKVEDFRVENFSELPAGRDGANKANFAMKNLLAAVEKRNLRGADLAGIITTVGDDALPTEASKDEGEVVPF